MRDREVAQSKLPQEPKVPYSKHTSPMFMENTDPEKYLKLGKWARESITPVHSNRGKQTVRILLFLFTFGTKMSYSTRNFYTISMSQQKIKKNIFV